MARRNQPDLFLPEPELFTADQAPVTYRPDLTNVRAELHKIISEARAAETLPWDAKRVRLYRTIFPQMTQWLPEEEGAQLRFDFETEMERLAAAA
jgi:hypothetical protein